MGRKSTFKKHGMDFALCLITCAVKYRAAKGESKEEIINSMTNCRHFFLPSEFGVDSFSILEGFEKDKDKERITKDECFSRTSLAKITAIMHMEGFSKEKIIQRVEPLLVVAYVTSAENQKLRNFQASNMKNFINNCTTDMDEEWEERKATYIKKYKKFLEELE